MLRRGHEQSRYYLSSINIIYRGGTQEGPHLGISSRQEREKAASTDQ